jgi:hypothetical protein
MIKNLQKNFQDQNHEVKNFEAKNYFERKMNKLLAKRLPQRKYMSQKNLQIKTLEENIINTIEPNPINYPNLNQFTTSNLWKHQIFVTKRKKCHTIVGLNSLTIEPNKIIKEKTILKKRTNLS